MKCFLILIAALVLSFGQAEAQHQLIWETEEPIYDINDVGFFPDGARVYNNNVNYLQIRNASDGSLITEMKVGEIVDPYPPDNQVQSVDVSSDGRYIAACGDFIKAIIYDAETYEQVAVLDNMRGSISCGFTSDGARLIIAERDAGIPGDPYRSVVTVWDVQTGEMLEEFSAGQNTRFLAVSPSGNYFAYAQSTKPWKVTVRDQQTYEIVAEYNIDLEGDKASIDGLQISNSGEYVIVNRYNTLYIYDINLKEIKYYHNIVSSKILANEFKKDDSIIIIIHNDGFTEYFEFPSMDLMKKDKSLLGKPLRLSPDDDIALLGRYSSISLYEIDWTPESTETMRNSENIKIYPNPAKNRLHVEFPEKIIFTEMEFSVTDINGKLIIEKESILNQNYFEIDIDLPAGVYFLNIKSQNFNATRKFVVE